MNPSENLSKLVFDPGLIRRYNVSGPRYTSYPTALQFSEFSQSDLGQAIRSSSNKDKDLSVYVHIPFCATLCYYCACNKIVTRKRQPAVEYLELLQHEIELVSSLFENRVVSQLHWGGGTPTFFEDEQIQQLMGSINNAFDFRGDDEGEFSIEIDPRTVDPDRIRHLRECGFNRLSFGIQDFDSKVQKAVNRVQSYEQTEVAIKSARQYGFRSVSVDLIYGLPHQSVESVARTLKQVITLSPDRISIYNYAHLPERFSPQKRILVSDMPSPDEKLEILQLCIETLTASEYVYIGMDHFAKPDDELAIAQREGTLQRNFQGYSTRSDCDLIAFGITGISQIGNTYCQNVKELDQYRTLLGQGRIPVEKGVVIDADDLIRKKVIKSLICQFELSYGEVNREFGIDFQTYFASGLDSLRPMVADELLRLDRDGITVTQQGRLLIRNICMVFDRYLQQQSASSTPRYSRAI
ncbi:MAG: oxygen-independent coproporphyrinogen III oxidase [bacterium]|nr:oxygen-independent coproporphyrinogen III oxidase [Gammaproteobacteria bacterium]HIL98072.1 oxygen-independent coproporphyrinogen III oxidase [Pseudomonadales bacterium]